VTKALRLALRGVSSGAALVAAVLAVSAGAATPPPAPTLSVSAGGRTWTTIALAQPPGGGAPGLVTVYVPAGYGGSIARQVGTRLGRADVQAIAADGAGALFAGPVVADDPSRYATSPCSPGMHDAVWRLALGHGDVSFDIPVFVDRAIGAETAFSSFKLQLCPPPPDLAAGTGAAPLGAQIVSLRLDLGSVLVPPPAGTAVWRAVWTPYLRHLSRLDLPATVESRSALPLPAVVAFRVSSTPAGLTWIHGRVTRANAGDGRATVTVSAGLRRGSLNRVGVAVTRPDGTFSLVTRRPAAFVQLTVVGAPRPDPAGCRGPATFAPVRCAAATLGGYSLRSALVRRG